MNEVTRAEGSRARMRRQNTSVQLEKRSHNPSREFKIIITGNSATGITAYRERITRGIFSSTSLPTLGLSIDVKKVKFKNEIFTFMMYDLSGRDPFITLRQALYGETQGVILVHDVTRPTTLQRLREFIEELRDTIGPQLVPVMILGNKIDLLPLTKGNHVGTQAALSLAMEVRSRLRAEGFDTPVVFANVSCRTGEKIQESFELFTTMLINYHCGSERLSDEELLLASLLT